MAFVLWFKEKMEERKRKIREAAGEEPEEAPEAPQEPEEEAEPEGDWYEPRKLKKTLRGAYRSIRRRL